MRNRENGSPDAFAGGQLQRAVPKKWVQSGRGWFVILAVATVWVGWDVVFEHETAEPMARRIHGINPHTIAIHQAASRRRLPSNASADREYPSGELGKMVRLGERIVNETSSHPLTKRFVGNSLSCTSCHLDAGRHPEAASFIGVAAAYPAYSPREKKVITLEDRILNCFIRSQNGTRPANGSKASVAIAAYITWLSEGTPIEMNETKPLGPSRLEMLTAPAGSPNAVRGETLYSERCAFCHGSDGEGSDDGPPVWGDDSFNDGAGLSKVPKMASWLKVAMPLDDADLSVQEAFDIAAFVNSQDRPAFRAKESGP